MPKRDAPKKSTNRRQRQLRVYESTFPILPANQQDGSLNALALFIRKLLGTNGTRSKRSRPG